MKYFVFVLMLLCAVPVFAQETQRVTVSDNDPKWREQVTVSYLPPDTSEFAKKSVQDTMYCAAILDGNFMRNATMLPMKRMAGLKYQCSFIVPDSTNSVRIEVCVPHDRLPDGITEFTCRTADGRPTPGYNVEQGTNVDSNLNAELAEYPHNYSAYGAEYDFARQLAQVGAIHVASASWHTMLDTSIRLLTSTPDTSASYYLALAGLYARSSHESLERSTLEKAAQVTEYDPLMNNRKFWNHFFAPVLGHGGGIMFDLVPGRIIAPLVENFPQTVMAKMWLQRQAYDTLLPSQIYRHVAAAWAGSNDVDLLREIAAAFAYKKGPLYDPAVALQWEARAEASAKSGAGFYSGENIYGSMDRPRYLYALKIELLGETGHIEDAIKLAEFAKKTLKPEDRPNILAALGKAYLSANQIEEAKRVYGEALAESTTGYVSGLSDLYQTAKEGSETQKEFASRLIKTYGGNVDLPVVPNFEFTTLDGVKGSLAEYRGKVVVLDCWFISCGGCMVEKASMKRLVDSFKGDTNVVFLSVALDDEKSLRGYEQNTSIAFPVVPNGNDICAKIGVSGYPTHIIIGRDGKTLGWEMGGSENSGDLMRPKIVDAEKS